MLICSFKILWRNISIKTLWADLGTPECNNCVPRRIDDKICFDLCTFGSWREAYCILLYYYFVFFN